MRNKLLMFFCGALLLGAMLAVSGFSASAYAAPETSNVAIKPASVAACPPTIRSGSRGEWVKALQNRLNELGWRDQNGQMLVVDGVFGSKTVFVVKNFQSVHAPPADGVVGPKTWSKLGYC